MRRAARELDEQQQQLSSSSTNRTHEAGRRFATRAAGPKWAKDLASSASSCSNLLERMRQTIEEAEEPEPLLGEATLRHGSRSASAARGERARRGAAAGGRGH